MSEKVIAVNSGLALVSGPCCICGSAMFYEKPMDDVGMGSNEICSKCSRHVAMEINYGTVLTDDYYTNKELFESYGITMEDLEDLEEDPEDGH